MGANKLSFCRGGDIVPVLAREHDLVVLKTDLCPSLCLSGSISGWWTGVDATGLSQAGTQSSECGLAGLGLGGPGLCLSSH